MKKTFILFALFCSSVFGQAINPGAPYTLPAASSSVLGGVKPDGTTIANTAGAISVGVSSLSGTAASLTAGAASSLTGTPAISVAHSVITDTTSAGSGSLAGSALSIAQTWNTTGTPTALLLNVTNTASNSGSKLMDLQIGGATKFSLDRAGNGIFTGGYLQSNIYYTTGGWLFINSGASGEFSMGNGGGVSWRSATTGSSSNGLGDTNLSRLTAGVIGVGTGAQGSAAGTINAAASNLAGVGSASGILSIFDASAGYANLALQTQTSSKWFICGGVNGVSGNYFGVSRSGTCLTPDLQITNAGNVSIASGGSANKAICWKADGKTLGYCSTIVDATGGCTCN